MAGDRKSALKLVAATKAANRRQLSRLDTLWQLHVEVVSCPVPATVREISTEGFSLETTLAFPKRGLNDFRFRLDGGSTVKARAMCVHCDAGHKQGSLKVFVAGFKFVQTTVRSRTAIDALVAQTQSLLAEGE